ncbi:MAG TPA: PhzF family phenazine biosynthesis protein [Acidimicrobiales bacterium]|nr:PhzF family phenazine biosynthesis protein [Acidimicrobiales bacterium]
MSAFNRYRELLGPGAARGAPRGVGSWCMDLTVVDAFTDRPFAGNPAAVAVLDAFPDEDRMQAVAAEMALSETAFVVPRPDGAHDLRWFSPLVEIDLCGHATLASAHVLGGAGRFHTRSGELVCTPVAGGWIEMDFPADELRVAYPAGSLPAAFGDPAAVRAVARSRADILVELADAAAVRGFRPDFAAIAALGTRGLLITAPGDRPGIDCVSRFFGPAVGVPEDPVTGSAHCTLAGYWGPRLGRHELVGEQASARGGVVRMRREGDRVVLGGRAVTVSQVRLLV